VHPPESKEGYHEAIAIRELRRATRAVFPFSSTPARPRGRGGKGGGQGRKGDTGPGACRIHRSAAVIRPVSGEVAAV